MDGGGRILRRRHWPTGNVNVTHLHVKHNTIRIVLLLGWRSATADCDRVQAATNNRRSPATRSRWRAGKSPVRGDARVPGSEAPPWSRAGVEAGPERLIGPPSRRPRYRRPKSRTGNRQSRPDLGRIRAGTGTASSTRAASPLAPHTPDGEKGECLSDFQSVMEKSGAAEGRFALDGQT
jgi:hypothetical protein